MSSLDKVITGNYSKKDLVSLLQERDSANLFKAAYECKAKYVAKKTYLRGLIELSNICSKNCYYCGLRCENSKIDRYQLDEIQFVNACQYASENGYGSIVIQTGERNDESFVQFISRALNLVKENSSANLRITLSCGEQKKEVYQHWKELGASRYLLRIESSNAYFYKKLHPNDQKHSFQKRLEALEHLKDCGYQVGSGFMIGVPGQTLEDLAGDILFLRDFNIDMVGMGPYVPNCDTPISLEGCLSDQERLNLALRVTSVVRLVLRDVNIAAATSLQALDPVGREKALSVGANVIMPNITPLQARQAYRLYDHKPLDNKSLQERDRELFRRIQELGDEVAFDDFGDSLAYKQRIGKR